MLKINVIKMNYIKSKIIIFGKLRKLEIFTEKIWI